MRQQSEITRLLSEISKHNLLTAEEEILLGRSIQQAIPFQDKEKGKLSGRERIYVRNAERARKRMIEGNLKLVYHATKSYFNSGSKGSAKRYASETNSFFLDLFQEGCIGLARAADKYDPERGYKFSTYAMWWIRQAITRAYYAKIPMIHTPEWVCQKYAKIASTIEDFKKTHSRLPSNKELSEILDLSVSKIKIILQYNYNVISLNQVIGNGQSAGESKELIDLVESPVSVDEELMNQIESLTYYIASLDSQEQEIINCRYGLAGHQMQTLDQLSKQHGLTRERIRQIQVKALNKIKFMLRMHQNGLDATAVFRKMNEVIQAKPTLQVVSKSNVHPLFSNPETPQISGMKFKKQLAVA
jgi:RNA polymerase sigma factor (sigma-70 family)